VAARLRDADPWVLVPAVALYFLGLLARSVRWRALLGGTLELGLLFRTLVIGLMVNDLFPIRLGEIARALLLARNASVPIGTSLASILVERVLDGLALAALLAVSIAMVGAAGWLVQLAGVAAILFAAATAVLIGAAAAPRIARRAAHALIRPLPDRWEERVAHLVDDAIDGLRPIARPAIAVQVFVLSILAWISEAGMYLVILTAFQIPGGLAAALMGTAVANLATLVPAGPSYIGTFDLALQSVLTGIFGAPAAAAASATLVIHLVLVVPVVVAGLFLLWRENLTLAELRRRPARTAPAPIAGR
jgi:uncharacterized protein (TIRG00374 family)